MRLVAGVAMTLSLVSLVACTPESPSKPAAPVAATTAASAVKPAAPKGDTFGQTLDIDTPFVALADILKDPKAYNGKKVRTRGEVIAVCQAAGCWCDLRPEGSNEPAAPTHVTMHNHAFFLPKTAKTKVAELEGNLVVRELSQAEVDHYNSEGASLKAGTPLVNVDALGVVLR